MRTYAIQRQDWQSLATEAIKLPYLGLPVLCRVSPVEIMCNYFCAFIEVIHKFRHVFSQDIFANYINGYTEKTVDFADLHILCSQIFSQVSLRLCASALAFFSGLINRYGLLS
jgi:hypothetical protein